MNGSGVQIQVNLHIRSPINEDHLSPVLRPLAGLYINLLKLTCNAIFNFLLAGQLWG